jgi:hypothetical protein
MELRKSIKFCKISAKPLVSGPETGFQASKEGAKLRKFSPSYPCPEKKWNRLDVVQECGTQGTPNQG